MIEVKCPRCGKQMQLVSFSVNLEDGHVVTNHRCPDYLNLISDFFKRDDALVSFINEMLEGRRAKCTACGGSGRVVSLNSFDYGSDGIETMRCPTCKGTGEKPLKEGDEKR